MFTASGCYLAPNVSSVQKRTAITTESIKGIILNIYFESDTICFTKFECLRLIIKFDHNLCKWIQI